MSLPAASSVNVPPDSLDAPGVPTAPTSARAQPLGKVPPLATVTVRDTVPPKFPAASCARAAMPCVPLLLDVLAHETEYGAVVSVATTVPSTRNSTRVTPTLSLALAEIVTVPLTVAPAAGEVSDTVGCVVSPGST